MFRPEVVGASPALAKCPIMRHYRTSRRGRPPPTTLTGPPLALLARDGANKKRPAASSAVLGGRRPPQAWAAGRLRSSPRRRRSVAASLPRPPWEGKIKIGVPWPIVFSYIRRPHRAGNTYKNLLSFSLIENLLSFLSKKTEPYGPVKS